MELKKDGIEPPMPKLSFKSHEIEKPEKPLLKRNLRSRSPDRIKDSKKRKSQKIDRDLKLDWMNDSDSDSRSSTSSFESQSQSNYLKSRSNRTRGTNSNRNENRPDDDKNRKMELCKFYLMDCCAKRDKCLYMHADFPCKFYYLGIRCSLNERNNCKFLHGKPLTDNLRAILLKHLETAPKEILGDFPRLSRDNAIKMLDTQHVKLMIEHGLELPKPVLPKIPSLLDMQIPKPSTITLSKSRKTRWCDMQSSKNQMFNQPAVTSNISMTSINPPSTNILQQPLKTSTNYLSLKFLPGVLTQEQIKTLESIGIENLDQVNQLTMAQLNDLGISIDQIRAIQLNAINIQKLGLPTCALATPTPSSNIQPVAINAPQDQDMRVFNKPKDIDMRVLPTIASPTTEPIAIDQSKVTNELLVGTSTSPTSKIDDYSKYLRDSNLENLLNESSSSSSNASNQSSPRQDFDPEDDECCSEPINIDERKTIYDSQPILNDDYDKNASTKADCDMRIDLNSDIDLRLELNTNNFIPGTEIDASISSHEPIDFRVCI